MRAYLFIIVASVLSGLASGITLADEDPHANWKTFAGITETATWLTVRVEPRRPAVGDAIRITVDVPSRGYLNVVAVGPDDSATVLFPNSYHPDNSVLPLPLRLPTPNMPFELRAEPPAGSVLVVAMLTSHRVNLYETMGREAPDVATFKALGRLDEAWVAHRGLNALLHAGSVEVEVCPAQCR